MLLFEIGCAFSTYLQPTFPGLRSGAEDEMNQLRRISMIHLLSLSGGGHGISLMTLTLQFYFDLTCIGVGSGSIFREEGKVKVVVFC